MLELKARENLGKGFGTDI